MAVYAYVPLSIAEALDLMLQCSSTGSTSFFAISLMYCPVTQQPIQLGLDLMLDHHAKTLHLPFLQSNQKQSPMIKNCTVDCKEFSEQVKPILMFYLL